MFILKHLKKLQHVSIIIQIIFRDLVCSLQSGIPLHTERTHTHQMLSCRNTTLTFYIFNKF